MKIELKLNERTKVCAEGDTPLELFKNLSELQEIFCEEKCGKCGDTNISYRVREAVDGKKTYEYPELVCNKCYAKFSFGQMEGGKLFPIRYKREGKEYVKDANGKLIPKGTKGWVKYNKDTGKEE